MRFKDYLNEITMVSNAEVEDILNMAMEAVGENIKKHPWLSKSDIILWIMLNSAFGPFGISILPKKIFGFTPRGIRNIDKAFYGIGTGKVVMALTKKDIDLVRTPSGRSKLVEKFFEALRHEMIHKKQYAGTSAEYRKALNRSMKNSGTQNVIDYFSDPQELEAYADQAVNGMLTDAGRKVWLTYAIIGQERPKVWKKFLKKTYQYMQSMDSGLIKKFYKIILDDTLKNISSITKEELKEMLDRIHKETV